MEKNEVVAYMVMEATSDPINRNLVEEHKDENGVHFLRFPTILQRFNVKNRNGRDYGAAAMAQGLAAENIQELIRKGSWCGESGHPMKADMERILTIDPANTSHRIVSYDIRGDMLHGVVETLDDNGEGTKLMKNTLQGIEPAFSLRALAKLIKQPNGTTLIRSQPRIVTYDRVYFPSHKEAYIGDMQRVQRVHKSIANTGSCVKESGLIALTEAEILNYIKEESNNVKLTSNIYDVCLQEMTLSADGSLVYVREGTSEIAIKIEDKIQMDYRSYMSKL